MENGKVVGSVELIENQEWKNGLQMGDKLHAELLRFQIQSTGIRKRIFIILMETGW